MTQAHFINFVGFLVQSVPCMLLCLLPFPAESFSIRRKYMVSLFGSLLLAAAAVFAFFACLPANQHGADSLPLSLEFYANLFMAATLILCVFLLFRTIRESLWKKLLVLCLVIDYAVFLYSGVNIALLLFPFPPIIKTGVYSDLSFSLYLILTLLTFADRRAAHRTLQRRPVLPLPDRRQHGKADRRLSHRFPPVLLRLPYGLHLASVLGDPEDGG